MGRVAYLVRSAAETVAAADRGRHPVFARHQALAAAPAGELGRSAAKRGARQA